MNLDKTRLQDCFLSLPWQIKKIFEIFGDNARLVGGSVRDLLLKKEVSDFDFATRLTPTQTTELLTSHQIKNIPTGIKYGTVTAIIDKFAIEITTLRGERNYDGRRCEVEFVDDYLTDAKRRDFTINAIYLDCHGNLHDYFSGISDLKNRIVKFIGDPDLRIEEDFLRILRFFRFSVEYANEIDLSGLKACEKNSDGLKNLSSERVRAEFLKMLHSKKRQSLLKILRIINHSQVTTKSLDCLVDVDALDRGFSLLDQVKFCNLDDDIYRSILLAIAVFEPKKLEISRLKRLCPTKKERNFFKFLSLCLEKKFECDLFNLRYFSLLFCDKKIAIAIYLFFSIKVHCAKNSKDLIADLTKFSNEKIPPFPVSARDLIELGFRGKNISKNLDFLKVKWLRSEFSLTRDNLLKNHDNCN